jgi:PAS domain S-box-containing protein
VRPLRTSQVGLLPGIEERVFVTLPLEQTFDVRDARSECPFLSNERLPLAYLMLDANDRVLEWNPAAEKLFGYRKAEVLGQDAISLLVAPPILEVVRDVFHRTAFGDHDVHSVNEIQTKDGRIITCEWFNTRLADADGKLIGVASLAQDITERIRIAEQLKESDASWAEAQRLARVGSWSWDIEKNSLLWSDEHYRIFGIQPQASPVTYDDLLAIIHPDDRARVEGRIAQAFRDHEPYECTMRAQRPDGSIRIVKSLGQLVFDGDGTPVRMFGTIQDITELSQAEDLIRENEKRFYAICNQAVAGISQVDLTGRFIFVNDRFYSGLGYSRLELLQMSVVDVTHPDDLPANLVHFRRLVDGGPDYLIEKRYVRKDGSVIWVRNHVNGIRNFSDRVESIVAVSVDITDQRRQEDALRTSEARYRNFVDHATDGLFLHDSDGRIVDVNRQACENLGYSCEELIGKTPDFFDHDLTAEVLADRVLRIGRGETIAFDTRHRRNDGSLFSVEVRVRPFEADGQGCALSLVHDISERLQTEETLRKNAKQLHDLSRRVVDVQEDERRHLAHELHDEIGQVLSAIFLNLQSVKTECGPTACPRIDESIGLVDHAARQVRNLSLDLRPSLLDDLGLISTLRWYAERQAERAGFQLHFEALTSGARLPAEMEITCFRVCQEALTNIVRHSKARNVWLTFQEQGDEAVQLIVRDDGVGVDLEEVRRRAGHGASFGIRGMRERVELLGGQLEVISEPSHGTMIRARLPLAADQ